MTLDMTKHRQPSIKTLILALLTAWSGASCVATAGDLRELNNTFAESVARASAEFDRALADQERALQALQEATARGATQEEVEELREEYEKSLGSTIQRADEAVSRATKEVADAVEDKVEEIKERTEKVAQDLAFVGEKISHGPQGWLELLIAVTGAATATGIGVNAHRNKTRQQALSHTQQQASQVAQQVAYAIAQRELHSEAYRQQHQQQQPQPPQPPQTPGSLFGPQS